MVWRAVVMRSHGTHLIRVDKKIEFLLIINPLHFVSSFNLEMR